MEHSLLYVSRKLLKPAEEDAAIADIVEVARPRNLALDITGALVATTTFFSQILEGPAKAIEELMESIYRDHRHADVTVLRVVAISRRSFPTWSLAYCGPSTYLARHIEPLIRVDGSDGGSSILRLESLIKGLAVK